MWDPISILYCVWVLNLNSIKLPSQRLTVEEVIQAKENKIFVDEIVNSVSIRQGL